MGLQQLRCLNPLRRLNPWRAPFLQGHPTDPNLDGPWRLSQWGLLVLPVSPVVAALLLFMGLVATCGRRWSVLRRDRVVWSLWGLGLWMAIATLWAIDRGTAGLGLANFLPYFWAFGVWSCLVTHPAQVRQLGRLLGWSGVPVAVVGLGQMAGWWSGPVQILGVVSWALEPGGMPLGRLAGPFDYANVAATYLLMALCALLGEAVMLGRDGRGRSPLQVSTIAAATLTAIALGYTQSRSGWLLAIAVLLGYGALLGWRRLWAAAAVLGAIVGGAAFGPAPVANPLRAIVPLAIWGRLNDSLYPNRPLPTLRWVQWDFAWKLTQLKPITGWGLRSFSDLYIQQTGMWLGHPHNLFLMLAAETGLPAAIALFALVGFVLAKVVCWLLRSRSCDPFGRSIPKLSMLSVAVTFAALTLVHGVDVTLFDWRIAIMGWLLLAGLWGVVRPERWRD